MKQHRAAVASMGGLIVALIVLGLAGCGSSSDGAGTDPSGDGVVVSDVWSRTTAAQAQMGAVYLTLQAPLDDELVAASVSRDIAASTEFHETTKTEAADPSEEPDQDSGEMAHDSMSGGMMGMREVSSVALPAGTPVTFEPGGYHVMLIDLAAPLEESQTFDVTLTFRTAPPRTVTATVRA